MLAAADGIHGAAEGRAVRDEHRGSSTTMAITALIESEASPQIGMRICETSE
jgi:hypothetical protein